MRELKIKRIPAMLRAWRKRQIQVRRSMRGTYIHRMLGNRLFRDYLWVHDKRGVAGGLALGTFIAFTPTIPLQMLLAAVGAIKLRLNLPIAMAACWITNPVSAGPIYIFAHNLGRRVLAEYLPISRILEVYFFPGYGTLNYFFRQSAYLVSGSLVLATVGAGCAYLLVLLLWAMFAKAVEQIHHTKAARKR